MTGSIVPGLVSTVIPVFNRAAMIREAVASVLAQTYRPIEIIIVDDGSTDDTPAAADQLQAAHPDCIHAVHVANGGPGRAREAGRILAQGEFIQYLDSDDVLLPDKFAMQVEALRRNGDCGIAYGYTAYVNSEGNHARAPWKRTGEVIDWMFPSFLLSRWWGTSTPLYRRSLTDRAGPWTSLSHEEDWEYDCRMAATGVRLAHVNAFVSEERDHGGPRLSGHGSQTSKAMTERAAAHALIFEHASGAGIDFSRPEMQHFARELFLLCRQCGAAGLVSETRALFMLAVKASGSIRGGGLDFRLYSLAASVLGWTLAGKLTCASDRLRQ